MSFRSSLRSSAGPLSFFGGALRETAALIFACGVIALSLVSHNSASAAEKAAKPNILIILADDK